MVETDQLAIAAIVTAVVQLIKSTPINWKAWTYPWMAIASGVVVTAVWIPGLSVMEVIRTGVVFGLSGAGLYAIARPVVEATGVKTLVPLVVAGLLFAQGAPGAIAQEPSPTLEPEPNMTHLNVCIDTDPESENVEFRVMIDPGRNVRLEDNECEIRIVEPGKYWVGIETHPDYRLTGIQCERVLNNGWTTLHLDVFDRYFEIELAQDQIARCFFELERKPDPTPTPSPTLPPLPPLPTIAPTEVPQPAAITPPSTGSGGLR